MKEMQLREIECKFTGGNQWSLDADKACGVDAYVHLCFTRGHPMEYSARKDGRIESTTWLRIHPSVIELPGVKICTEVSNKSGAVLRDAASAIADLDLEIIHKKTDWKNPEMKSRLSIADKYELLVPKFVPISFVQNPDG